VIRWLNPAQDQIDAGYVAHPSLVEREELAAIRGPLSIAAAGTSSIPIYCLLFAFGNVPGDRN
jgi:hypothetical protein